MRRYLPIFESPLASNSSQLQDVEGSKVGPSEIEDRESREDGGKLPTRFIRHKDTTNDELFYDLFFVANLTVFTSVHEVDSSETLKSYVGFFALLWITWYQVALYDVRFSTDDLFNRAGKLCQFGVMIGLAISGPDYQVGTAGDMPREGYYDPFPGSLRALTIILMASRFLLTLQYLPVIYFTRDRKQEWIPLAITAATYFVTGWVYFGLYWLPVPPYHDIDHRYIGWYVVAGVESFVVITIPAIWKEVSFEHTHLTERMSLLTLIILGEGVIGLAEQCQNIVQGQLDTFTSPIIAAIACGILALYFLYWLYFDWLPKGGFGPTLQQFWSFAHFPLHVALVLAVEGIRRNIAWVVALVNLRYQLEQIDDFTVNLARNSSAQLFDASAKNLTDQVTWPAINASIAAAQSDDEISYAYLSQETLMGLAIRISHGATNYSDFELALNTFFTTIGSLTFTAAGFKPPEELLKDCQRSSNGLGQEEDCAASQDVEVYQLAFVYFFVALGLAVVLYALLAVISKRPKRPEEYIRYATVTLIGIGLCLVALIDVNEDSFGNFVSSYWILPTATLALFAAILVQIIHFSFPGLLKRKV